MDNRGSDNRGWTVPYIRCHVDHVMRACLEVNDFN